jgi:hypothetical protein
VQLVSKLLGVEFDAIWQRHKRLLIQKMVAYAVAILAVLAALVGVWVANQPVDVKVRLNEASVHNGYLPPLRDAVVTLMLDNETKSDTVQTLDGCALFSNIPHRYLNKEARMTMTCQDFMNIDTTLVLTKDVVLNIQRDAAVYGDVHFRLWNPETEQAVAGTELEVAGQKVISDNSGRVSLFVPLGVQRSVYQVASSVPLANDTIYMPCGPDDVILAK